MTLAMEVGWEESGVARLKGLLKLGNEVWEGEPVAGYPVDRLHSFCGHFLVAYGATADQRRRSRAELWQRQGSFTQAMLYPQTDCRDSYIVAQYLKARGYEILPVNPAIDEVLGCKAYKSLAEVPGHIDIVDVFRKSDGSRRTSAAMVDKPAHEPQSRQRRSSCQQRHSEPRRVPGRQGDRERKDGSPRGKRAGSGLP